MALASAAGWVLAANPGSTNVSATNMSESGLIVLSIGAMICVAALLLMPVLAGRAPRRKEPVSTPPWTGPVQGGVHLGDGRSVAPHRDDPAEPFDQETVARAQAQATVVRDDEDGGEDPGQGSGAGSARGE